MGGGLIESRFNNFINNNYLSDSFLVYLKKKNM